jgi:hypothetical protein
MSGKSVELLAQLSAGLLLFHELFQAHSIDA